VPLTLYTRHVDDCPAKAKGRFYSRCGCNFAVQGRSDAGKYLRQSLDTADPKEAREKADRLEHDLSPAVEMVRASSEEGKTIEDGKKEFLAELKTRNLNGRTIYKYEFLFGLLGKFAAARGFRVLKQFDKDSILTFRAEWTDGPNSRQKKFERLRQFFKFAHESGWIDRNPTTGIKPVKFRPEPKDAFTDTQMQKILGSAAKKIAEAPSYAVDNARRLRALILFMRYSGLRIGDATSAEVASLQDGKLSRHTQKTGSHVYLEIPPEVIRALDEIPKASERFWFWSGNGKLETASKDWQGRLADLFEDAGIQDGHSHRFRHTFAKDHLSKGTSMQDLSKLLGHASIKVTEKYYAKWCTERQEKASAAMRRTWINDPVLAWEREANSTDAKLERADEAEPVSEEVEVAVPPASTRQVREKRRTVN